MALAPTAARAALWLGDTGDVQTAAVLILALTDCFSDEQSENPVAALTAPAVAPTPAGPVRARVVPELDVATLVPRATRRLVLHSYGELLRRFGLTVEATSVLKHGKITSLAAEAQKGTAMVDSGVSDPGDAALVAAVNGDLPPSAAAAAAAAVAVVTTPAAATPSASRRGGAAAAQKPACSLCQETVGGLWVWCHGCGHGGHLDHLLEWFAHESAECPSGCGHRCSAEMMTTVRM
jgi:hypothetical protein